MAEEIIKDPVVETPPITPKEGEGDADETVEEKVFTQEDLDRVAAKTRAEEKTKADKALEEEKRLAKLSEDERKAEEQKKHDKEMTDRETELKVATNKLAFTKKFEADDIPNKFIDYITDKDPEKMEAKYNAFKTEWNDELNKKLEEKVKPTSNPKAFNVNSEKPKSLIRSI